MAETISGNITGLYIAEEQSLKVLPASPVWYEREPNSYGDFGTGVAMTTRMYIKHDRQHGKGEVSDNDPVANWNEDLTNSNAIELMSGFMWADRRAKPSSASTAAAASSKVYTVASSVGIVAGSLVHGKGFTNAANNGLHSVSAVGSGTVTVNEALADETGAAATLAVVGFQFPSADLSLTKTAANVRLTSATLNMTTFGFVLGEWAFVGGDGTATRFADSGDNAPFFGRISAITATYIEFDKTTGTQVTNAGTGKTVRMFFGTVVKNEQDCALIKRKSWTCERVYGCGTDAQSEFVTGAVPNQVTITVPTPGADAKVNMDFAFIGMGSGERLGSASSEAVLSAGGVTVPARKEGAIKPGLDVYSARLSVVDATTLNPTSLVAYTADATIVINNNVQADKAIGVFGNFAATPGEFTVTGSTTGFFTSVAAARAVRQGADFTYHLIATRENGGVIFDIASLGIGTARPNIEANSSVKIPFDTAAGEGKNGYTLLTNFFRYLPNVGMANQKVLP